MTTRVTPNFRVQTPKRNWRSKRDGNDKKHLANLRKLPCCVCGNPPPNTVHHLKVASERGIGLKAPDRYGIPMCLHYGDDYHNQVERVGSKNELAWFAERGIDALKLAADLWRARGDLDWMKRILYERD